MMPKHASVVVCLTRSVVSGAIPLATTCSRRTGPGAFPGAILQLETVELGRLLAVHFLPEVQAMCIPAVRSLSLFSFQCALNKNLS